jgi:hypothetical protein
MNPTWLAYAIISAGVLIAGSLVTYFVRLNQRITEQDKKISTLEAQMSPLWSRVQATIAADLHHPHARYFEMDKLLEKLEGLTIEEMERERLKELLEERSRDMTTDITQIQRVEAKLMIQVMDLVVLEAATENQQGVRQ